MPNFDFPSNDYQLDFFSYDHFFCEMTLYGQPPEYFNAFSALFLSFIGFFGLFKGLKIPDITYIYTSFIVNGIASFLYHYTNYLGWGLMDRFSMIMIAIYFYNLAFKIFEYFDICSSFFDILRVFSTFYFTVLLTICGLQNELLFNILFGFFLGSTVLFMTLVQFMNKKFDVPTQLLTYGWKGIGLISTAGGFWILTESFCQSHWIIKYLFGHSIWHICVGLGGYYISVLMSYLLVKSRKLKVKYLLGLPYLKYMPTNFNNTSPISTNPDYLP